MKNSDKNQKSSSVFAVALSGGVDSFIAAHTLKTQGKEVVGIHMQNWIEDEAIEGCSAQQDLIAAKQMAEQLDIPLFTVSFSTEYWHRVFSRCLDEFAKGNTPNPDVLCNREIKFQTLLNYAQSQGAHYLATGHYARITYRDGEYYLLKSHDAKKDQTYFLYLLTQSQLKAAQFPIGGLQKKTVRQIAKNIGCIYHDKKDSVGICFIGKKKFQSFLKEFLLSQPGNIETLDGKIIGTHMGVIFYTIGQRKGLNIGGQRLMLEKPWYVLCKDRKRNVLIVGQGDHPMLYTKKLICHKLHWINNTKNLTQPFTCTAKIRHQQIEQTCTVEVNNDQALVQFDRSQRAITEGQSIVFYQGEYCLGGGIMQSPIGE